MPTKMTVSLPDDVAEGLLDQAHAASITRRATIAAPTLAAEYLAATVRACGPTRKPAPLSAMARSALDAGRVGALTEPTHDVGSFVRYASDGGIVAGHATTPEDLAPRKRDAVYHAPIDGETMGAYRERNGLPGADTHAALTLRWQNGWIDIPEGSDDERTADLLTPEQDADILARAAEALRRRRIGAGLDPSTGKLLPADTKPFASTGDVGPDSDRRAP